MLSVILLGITDKALSQSNTAIADSVRYEFKGVILSKDDAIIKVQQTDSAQLPARNTEGTLTKHFDKILFGANITGWLDVGKMKVVSIDGNVITFKLLEEISVIVVDGQKEDHFQPGFVVKFIWKEK